MTYLILFVWWAAGAGIFLGTCFSISGKVIVKDLLVTPLFGLGGPPTIIWWLIFANKSWMNKTVWPRPKKS